MNIDAIDFMKEYVANRRYLRVAVRIVDGTNRPVVWSTVHLMALGPDFERIAMTSTTDFEGFAHFSLGEVREGKWTFKVSGVDHPCYRLSTPLESEKRRFVRV
jgi:hypothetical protein